MRKNFHQRRPKKVKGEVGLLERKPKKRKMPKTRMRRKQLRRRRRQVEGRPQCTRRTVKKVGMELIQSLKLLRTTTARMTSIQKPLQRRRLPQRRSPQSLVRKDAGDHQDLPVPRRRKSRAQSTTSTTFLTHRLNLRRARTIPTTQTIDPMLPIQG